MRPLPVSIPQTPLGRLARDWLVRHRRMVAWNDAVLINTASGYRSFLAKFPDSDLTATARKLEERLRNRPEFTPAVAAANAAVPQNVALAGPTCPCNVQPPQPQPHEGQCAGQARRAGSAEEAGRSQAAAARSRRMTTSWSFAVRPARGVRAAAGPSVGIGIGIGRRRVLAAAATAVAVMAVAAMAAGVDTEAAIA